MPTTLFTGTDANDTLTALTGDNLLLGDAGGDSLVGGTGKDTLDGGVGNDLLIGSTGGGLLLGGAGDDTLRVFIGANAGQTTVNGGSGSDLITLQYSTQQSQVAPVIIEFGRGSGRDSVYLRDTAYVIRLAPGIAQSDLEFVAREHESRPGNKYIDPSHLWSWDLRIKGTSDGINVDSGIQGGAGPTPIDSLRGLQGIEFADGTRWSPEHVLGELRKVENSLGKAYGSSGADVLQGNAADHTLYGFGGDDTLISGTGNELFEGGNGSNVYRFEQGWGRDTITGGSGTVEFGAGVAAGSLKITQLGDDVLLAVPDGSSLLIQGMGRNGGLPLGMHFADGTQWAPAELFRRAYGVGTDRGDSLRGTSAAEVLDGGAGPDSIAGLGGFDTLQGGAGNDTLISGGSGDVLTGGAGDDLLRVNVVGTVSLNFDRGFGHDAVGPSSSSRILADFGTIKSTEITLYQDNVADGGSALVVRVNDTGDTVHFWGGIAVSNDGPSELRFGDGKVWTSTDLASAGSPVRLQTSSSATGTAGNDTLTGTDGSDLLTGGGGSDTYVMSGLGHDVIDLVGAADNAVHTVLVKGAGRLQSAQVVEDVWGDFRVTFDGMSDLTLRNFRPDQTAGQLSMRFDDGTTLNVDGLQRLAIAGTAASEVRGSTQRADRYEIGPEQGHDAITSFVSHGSHTDRLVLSTSDVTLTPFLRETIRYSGVNLDIQGLQITFNETGETIRVSSPFNLSYGGTFLSPNNHLSVLEFPDGSTLTGAEVWRRLNPLAPVDTTPRTLQGTSRDDRLQAGGGDDTITGGAGDDLISLDAGWQDASHDTVIYNRGDGRDTITARNSYNLKLGAGIALSELSISQDSLLIGDSADRITGLHLSSIELASGEVLDAAAITALRHKGSAFADRIVATDGADVVTGGEGSDTIQGGLGADLLDGGNDSDNLWGGEGADTLVGGRGNDTLSADADDTLLYNLGDGDDQVIGQSHTLRFGAGIRAEDLVIAPASVSPYGIDRAPVISIKGGGSLTGGLPSSIVFADGSVLDADQILRATFTGSAGNDYISGSARADSLSGEAGDDRLLGIEGDDTLVGGAGNDLLEGGQGQDLIIYGRGDGRDTVTVGDTDTLSLNRGIAATDFLFRRAEGNAVVLALNGSLTDNILLASENQLAGLQIKLADGSTLSGATAFARSAANKHLVGGGSQVGGTGSDWLEASKYASDFSASGGSGNDVLVGRLYNDTLDGGAGDDVLFGGNGRDRFIGGRGNDTIDAWTVDPSWDGSAFEPDTIVFLKGDGRDLLQVDGLDVIELGAGLDRSGLLVGRLDATAPNTVVLSFTGGTDTLTLDRAGQWDALTLKFANGSTLSGAEIMQEARNPTGLTLTGTIGRDALIGKTGDDTLTGLAGSDTLTGGLGNDRLLGGKGNDTYAFARGDGHDTIVEQDSTWLNSDLLKMTGATSRQLWFTKAGNNLDVSIIGTTDKVTIQDWYSGNATHVERFTAGDGKSMSHTKVNALVSAMSAFAPPVQGQTTLPTATATALTTVLASSWA